MKHLVICTLLALSLSFFLPLSSLVAKLPHFPEPEVLHSLSALAF